MPISSRGQRFAQRDAGVCVILQLLLQLVAAVAD
jgi:hypothetical protein